VLPWNLRQLISYFFALIIYSINLLKTARKTFATGNAIYPLPRTIIQITNDNSIFRKEGITISALASSAVNRGFQSQSSPTKDSNIDICCFSAKHAALRRKSNDCLARNQDNVYDWSNMPSRRLLFQGARTIKTQLSVLV
jgi:hypothetical protein